MPLYPIPPLANAKEENKKEIKKNKKLNFKNCKLFILGKKIIEN
jgi:hypothetical protein